MNLEDLSGQEEIVKGYDPVIMKRLLKALLPYWKIVVLIVVSLLIATVAELASPVVMQRAVDNYILNFSDRGLTEDAALRGLGRYALIFLVLLITTLLFSFIQVYLASYLGQRVMRDLRNRLMDHTLRQSLGFLQTKPVGSLVSRVTNDIETINEFFSSVSTAFLKDGSLMIGVFIALFLLDKKLALITLATVVPVIIITLIFRYKARDAYRNVQMWTSRINAYLSEHISGMGIVQIFGTERRSMQEFSQIDGELLRSRLGEMMVFALFRPLINLFTSVSLGVIIYFGAGMHSRQGLTLGVLIAFINLIGKFYHPVMELSEQFTILQSAMAGGERIFQLMDQEDKIPDTGKKRLPQSVGGEIKFSRVSFSYLPGEPVLKGLSFKVNPGETVAIVGYTGAGKTTIANLLTRLWDHQGGTIYLDGRDIREYPLEELRRTIIPVQQDVFLFSGTVEENIALGKDMDKNQIIQAAKLVHAHEFISSLPEGYSTLLREGGSNLSTGQRQLISFARVIAHDPKVVILDEATGSVDTETERLIQKGLSTLLTGRTSLVIAHRLSTIHHADRILVLSGGKLLEEGTHKELINKQGLYYNLYKLQYQGGL